MKDEGLSTAVVDTRVAAAAENNTDSTKPSSPMTQGGNEQQPNICALPATSACRQLMVKETRQQIQAAAARGDYILAGKMQEVLTRLTTLCQEMQQAAQQNDFILAGHLQTQLNAFAEFVAKKKTTTMMFSGHESFHSRSRSL